MLTFSIVNILKKKRIYILANVKLTNLGMYGM